MAGFVLAAPLQHGVLKLGPVVLHGNSIWIPVVILAVLVAWHKVARASQRRSRRRGRVRR
jgi:hypothetical protein